MGIKDIYKLFIKSTGVSTDTRNIKNGSLFFALKGETFNGNRFAYEAITQGAAYAIVDEDIDNSANTIIKVDNVLQTLQELSSHHRNQLDIPVIGITGSNGKTTTKELIASVLSTKFKVHFTQGNFNNHLGVPLTLLAMPQDTDIAVIEMGANHIGEIANLCKIANPNYGIITNIGKAHLEGFGGVEGVLRAKSELYQHILAHGETVFINSQDEVLNNMSKRFNNPIKYPRSGDFFECKYLGANPFVEFEIDGKAHSSRLIGKYNFDNIASALTIGFYFKVPLGKAVLAIKKYIPTNNRSQVIKTAKNTLILDAYNANPGSMQAAIENFAEMDAKSKSVILGDMLELGEDSAKEHELLGKLVGSKKFNAVLFCGTEIRKAAPKCIGSLYFKTKAELSDYLTANPLVKTTVLIKASRSIGLETLAKKL
ncbi:MAG: UDP-N-acetylmuramoyl-tripeptide--D-alanyl-D-alanine ligase [Cyclobacteriaceae bacterium]|nr:UDP-N-acetylmuramoyl-tripeptide--D-alanyl-D-alanine ligase [Cyclobacteriaceae bacterium]